SIAHFSGIYTYGNLMHNYQDLVAYVDSNPVKIPFLREERMTIRNAKKIRAAIDYQHPDVRNFAVKSAKNHFSDAHLKREHGRVLLYFSIFKTIRNSWIYIPDPKGEEYYAKASETIDHLSGDCDDYSIIMAACIRAVGGDVRLVHTKGHLYPEVKIGKLTELEDIIYLIKRKLFLKESLGGKIYYHIDRNDNVWINFDYTNWYPGGKFMDEKIIGIMVV
ncbi:MAG: hypothetical protein RQ866_05515, partial [Bacteroidales bacterium]|nr:hypothetical protein [Bacteroidales bacterium]